MRVTAFYISCGDVCGAVELWPLSWTHFLFVRSLPVWILRMTQVLFSAFILGKCLVLSPHLSLSLSLSLSFPLSLFLSLSLCLPAWAIEQRKQTCLAGCNQETNQRVHQKECKREREREREPERHQERETKKKTTAPQPMTENMFPLCCELTSQLCWPWQCGTAVLLGCAHEYW